MSLHLVPDLEPLLAPARLVAAAEVLSDRAIIPDEAGIYGWWFATLPPGVPEAGTLHRGSFHLLYVGIAPRAPGRGVSASKSTLRKRIRRDHLGKRIASSTLRRSLAWLLSEQLELRISRNKARKWAMPTTDEAKLSAWIGREARLSFLISSAPWEIEHRLIRLGPALPLNIAGSDHPHCQTLLSLRQGHQRHLGQPLTNAHSSV